MSGNFNAARANALADMRHTFWSLAFAYLVSYWTGRSRSWMYARGNLYAFQKHWARCRLLRVRQSRRRAQ